MELDIINIIQIFTTILIAFATAYFTNINERKKQTTVFFKEEGIKSQKEILDFWSTILLNDFETAIKKYIANNSQKIMKVNNLTEAKKISDTMIISEVQKDSYMYSSRLTIKYIGNYMQEIFKEESKSRPILQTFLVGKVISNMKYDFTGEKTTVMDLLRMKINDLTIDKILKIYWYEIKYFFKTNYVRL